MNTCSVADCLKPSSKRGWCEMHYWRQKRHGSLDAAGIKAPPDPRPPMDRIDKSGPGGCWIWTGRTNPKGYGELKIGRQGWRAHRWVYTQLVGPIPDGLEIDHLCKVTACVNPEHLEPVTRRENLARSDSLSSTAIRLNTCMHGHDLAPENVYRIPSRPNERRCRICIAERRAKRKAATSQERKVA